MASSVMKSQDYSLFRSFGILPSVGYEAVPTINFVQNQWKSILYMYISNGKPNSKPSLFMWGWVSCYKYNITYSTNIILFDMWYMYLQTECWSIHDTDTGYYNDADTRY